ncbi:MAG: hypothetical protein KGD61_01810 [Candidatus Lokiarchaeota archaeon]|nr:hypothetical protein [Candidatus Lokiarchaeota archaeon]
MQAATTILFRPNSKISFLIICCPGSLHVKLFVLAITTLGNSSAKFLTASQSR